MKHMSKVLDINCNFTKMIATQFSETIKIFRSDNVMENKQTNFINLLNAHGNLSHCYCPRTSKIMV